VGASRDPRLERAACCAGHHGLGARVRTRCRSACSPSSGWGSVPTGRGCPPAG